MKVTDVAFFYQVYLHQSRMALPDASHITSLNEAVVHLKAVSLEDIPTVYISSLRSNKHGIYTYRPSIYIRCIASCTCIHC